MIYYVLSEDDIKEIISDAFRYSQPFEEWSTAVDEDGNQLSVASDRSQKQVEDRVLQNVARKIR